jgi:hypothetical protein
MPNHVHHLLGTGRVPMAVGMARLGTGYAGYFNARHQRVGHFFQNRYRSLPVEDESYFLSLVRYVHLNPVRAGIVPDVATLAAYPWTGHAALMGTSPPRFQDVGSVLDRFAAERDEARRRLARWMGELESGAVETLASRDPTVAELASRVAASLGQSERELRSGARRGAVSQARAALAHLACNVLGWGPTGVARELGLSHTAVSRAAARGARIVAGNGGLARLEAQLRASRS